MARAEAIHIGNHQRALEKNHEPQLKVKIDEPIITGSLAENIEAIQGEHEEISSMYPSFIAQIKKCHGKDFVAKIALLSLIWAMDAEKVHLTLLQFASKQLSNKEDRNPENFYLCRVCGSLVYEEKTPEEICPVCGHDSYFYSKV